MSLRKKIVLSIICSKHRNEEEKSIEILGILGLNENMQLL